MDQNNQNTQVADVERKSGGTAVSTKLQGLMKSEAAKDTRKLYEVIEESWIVWLHGRGVDLSDPEIRSLVESYFPGNVIPAVNVT